MFDLKKYASRFFMLGFFLLLAGSNLVGIACSGESLEPLTESSVKTQSQALNLDMVEVVSVKRPEVFTISEPYAIVDGERVRADYCLNLGRDCGKPAADAICVRQGFDSASRFAKQDNIGRTYVSGADRICSQPSCDGFKFVACRGAYKRRPSKKYYYPTLATVAGQVRLDYCFDRGRKCGRPAADAFCIDRGYSFAENFTKANNLGRTFIQGPRTECNHPSCDGFTYISCKGGPDLPVSPAVVGVLDQVRRIDDDAQKLHIPYVFENRNTVYPELPKPVRDNDGSCHVQGFQRLPLPGYMVFTANSRAKRLPWPAKYQSSCKLVYDSERNSGQMSYNRGAHLFVARVGSVSQSANDSWGALKNVTRNDRVVRNFLLNESDEEHGDPRDQSDAGKGRYHPGGIQAVGTNLFLGYDDRNSSTIQVWDFANPYAPYVLRELPKAKTNRHKANAVAAVAGNNGRHLVVVKADNKTLQFYLEDMSEPPFTFKDAGTFDVRQLGKQWESYSGFNLVRDQQTKRVYLIGLAGYGSRRCVYGVGDYVDSVLRPASTHLHVWRIDNAFSDGSLPRRLYRVYDTKLDSNHGAACAGSGVYVDPAGQLRIYMMEHWGNDKDRMPLYEHSRR